MSNTLQYSSGQPQTAPNRWLWAAVGALGATTLAMGVALVQMRADPTPVPAPSATPVVALPALNPQASAHEAGPAAAVSPVKSEQKQPVAPARNAQAATKNIASTQPTAQTPPEPVTANLPPPPPPRVICAHCATVTAVTPVEREGAGSGAGAVAGALLGGLLGNQVGGGTGKTIATVVGAVGGGYAGNTVEKRMKKETRYQVDLRMDDGSTQRLEHRSPLSVGTQVTVNGGVITP